MKLILKFRDIMCHLAQVIHHTLFFIYAYNFTFYHTLTHISQKNCMLNFKGLLITLLV